MSADASDDTQIVHILGGGRASAQSYHTDPECPKLKSTNRTARAVPLDALNRRELCKACSGDQTLKTGEWGNGECRSCGEVIIDGECFCDRFDAVHDIPSAVDLAWLRRFAAAPEVFVR